MKKTLFFIVALAAVAIGCTKSEVVKAPGRGREIKFDTYVGKTPMTKAESADLDYVKRATDEGGFQVYAFLHNEIPKTQDPTSGELTFIDVSKVGTATAYMDKVVTWYPDETLEKKGYWDYDGVVYWPDHTTTRKLAFAAYGLNVKDDIVWDNDPTVAGNEKAGHPAEQSYTKFTYTVPTNVADQKDLLVAPFLPNCGLSANTEATPVSINFKHLLSRVGFQVVANQTTQNVEIKIDGIKLVGKFPTTGKVDLKGTGVIVPNIAETDPFETQYSFFHGEEFFVTTSKEVATDIFADVVYVKAKNEATDEPTDEPENNETPDEPNNGEENGAEAQADDDTTPTYTEIDNTDGLNRYMMIMPSQQAKHLIYEADGVTPSLDEDGNVQYIDGQTLPGAYIEVNYQLTDAEPQVARVSLDNWNFEAGKAYTFIFKVSTYDIKFDVNVGDWDPYFGPVKDEEGKDTYPNGNGTYTLTPIV